MKTGRRKARADALQILYQLDLNRELTPQSALGHFEKFFSDTEIEAFARVLIIGVTDKLAELDMKVDSAAENWRTDRMAIVDRNILRIGCYELFHCDDVPATVTINEMVELAKEYGSETSPSFINGVLDRLKLSVQRPEKAK